MSYARFMMYNVIGAIVWVPVVTMLGYWAGRVLGHYINIDHYILPAIFIATVCTFGISFTHVLRDPISRQKLINKFKTPPKK
jgi:membrane protein DedA with SNARE-associated domain